MAYFSLLDWKIYSTCFISNTRSVEVYVKKLEAFLGFATKIITVYNFPAMVLGQL